MRWLMVSALTLTCVALATGCDEGPVGTCEECGGGGGAGGGGSAGDGGMGGGGVGGGGVGGGGTGGMGGGELPSCDDLTLNQDETDVDCGGEICDPCALGDSCAGDGDCAGTLTCGVEDTCAEPCADGLHNQDETDVDCGGEICVPCALGAGCVDDDDCLGAAKCDTLVCADTCADQTPNYGESDVDCGGTICPLCLAGQSCTTASDCEGGLSCPAGSCVDPCADGSANGAETDTDCGGPDCAPCAEGLGCDQDEDCLSGWCDGGGCALRTTAMSAEELCFLYRNFDQYDGELCMAGAAPSVQDWDADALTTGCRPGTVGYAWGEHLLEAVADARVAIDWEMAHRCVAESRALRINNPSYLLLDETAGTPGAEWAALRDGDCRGFYAGLVVSGDSCRDTWDCVDGLVCGSTAPWTTGGAQCLPPPGDGEACDDWLNCDDSFFCDQGLCSAKGDLGATCARDLEGEDCLSGNCEGQNDLCSVLTDAVTCASASECEWITPPYGNDYCDAQAYACEQAVPGAAIGEECTAEEDCAGGCVRCRPADPGDILTCERPSEPGGFCRNDHDCLPDLTCVDYVCGKLGRGRACSDVFVLGGQCRAGYTCLPPVDDCSGWTGDQQACLAEPGCVYDDYHGWCNPLAGECHQLPASGPCIYGYCDSDRWCDDSAGQPGECLPFPESGECTDDLSCAEGFFCDDSAQPTACLAQAAAGEACDDDFAASCVSGYTCFNSLCVVRCDYPEDCAGDEYCDGDSHRCLLRPSQCSSHLHCPTGDFCQDAIAVCGRFQADTTACVTDDRCEVAEDLCVPTGVACSGFDGDPTGCAGAGGCVYGACSDIECTDLSGDETACTDTGKCAWDESGVCYAIDCYDFDGNPTACESAGICTYDEINDWCDPLPATDCWALEGDFAACTAAVDCMASDECLVDPALDCSIHDGNPTDCAAADGCETIDVCIAAAWSCFGLSEGDCDSHDGCAWDTTDSNCEKITGECVSLLDAGALCYGDADCESDYCTLDQQSGDGVKRCEVRLSRGCYHDSAFLRGAFLFGLVWALGRAGRRTRKSD